MFHELRAEPMVRAADIDQIDLRVTAEERAQLLRWIRSPTLAHRLVVRSRIVLLASEGLSCREISKRLATRPRTVRLWCDRFRRCGLAAIQRDAPGRGRRPGAKIDVTARVLAAMTDEPSHGRWTARSLARHAGTSASTVCRIWTRTGLRPSSAANS